MASSFDVGVAMGMEKVALNVLTVSEAGTKRMAKGVKGSQDLAKKLQLYTRWNARHGMAGENVGLRKLYGKKVMGPNW